METEMELEDVPTRQSSKFSLGSSLSVLSADEQLDGEGPLTPTDKIQDDEDDDMSELNSLANSPGSLSNEEVTDDEDVLLDDLHSEHDSASPLSSIPDDFPLSRSVSPEINEEGTSEEKEFLREEEDTSKMKEATTVKKEKLKAEEDEEEEQKEEEEEEEEDDEEEETMLIGTTSTRGRRKEAITRLQKLKQRKQKGSNIKVKSVGGQAKDKENEKETGSRRKRTKKEDSSDKSEEAKSKKQRTSEPKSRKGLNKQLRREKQVEEEEVEDEEDQQENNAFKDGKKEEVKIEECADETKDNGEAMEEDEPEKETQAKASNNTTGDNDKNTENIEQSDPEIKTDLQGQDGDDEKRRKEAWEALTHIEVEFARLRDKMYQEKMIELNEEAMSVANGTHPDLVASIAEIEEKKAKRISSAEAWRKHQYANFKTQFEGFEYQANVQFISQKNTLRTRVLSGLNDKKWRIEDEHTKLNDSISKQYPDRQQMVAHKQKQKDEMAELRDIRQTGGFPMAPDPTGLCAEDVDDDLRKLCIEHHL